MFSFLTSDLAIQLIKFNCRINENNYVLITFNFNKNYLSVFYRITETKYFEINQNFIGLMILKCLMLFFELSNTELFYDFFIVY